MDPQYRNLEDNVRNYQSPSSIRPSHNSQYHQRQYENRPGEHYKSRSEVVVARALEKGDLKFDYEERVYIEHRRSNDQKEKGELWYPDFHLKDHGIIVEYAGRQKNESSAAYKKRIEAKKKIYEANNAKVVWIYPEDIRDPSQNYKIRPDAEERVLQKVYKEINKEENYKLKEGEIESTLFNHNYKSAKKYAA